jgi:hypothetical protein
MNLDHDLVFSGAFMLLVVCRTYSLSKLANGNWEILNSPIQGDNEIFFADEEVAMARDAGMLEMAGSEVVIGLSELEQKTLSELEKSQDAVFEFCPPDEADEPQTVH